MTIISVIVIAVVAGLLIGLSLGALGGGGSILAVPVLVYLLSQTADQATTGSLVVVGVTSLVGAVTAARAGKALVGRGITFGLVAIVGAAAGAAASTKVAAPVLLAAFAGLLVVVAAVMITRTVRAHRARNGATASGPQDDTLIDEPIIALRPEFRCRCAQAAAVLVTATVVGLLTGFLGVGGGFLVVPALVLAMGLPMAYAAGTSLVVITITSASALVVRAGAGVQPDWPVVLLLTAAAVVGSWAGVKAAGRINTSTLQAAFSGLLVVVAGYTAWQAVPQIL